MNVEFVILSYLIGMAADWILQVDWQARNKSKWDKNDNKKISAIAVISHSLIYAVVTSFSVLLLMNYMRVFWIVFLTLFISHTFIDTRIPVKWIMRHIKRMKPEQIYDYQNYGFMHIGIDHRLHEMVIVILGFII